MGGVRTYPTPRPMAASKLRLRAVFSVAESNPFFLGGGTPTQWFGFFLPSRHFHVSSLGFGRFINVFWSDVGVTRTEIGMLSLAQMVASFLGQLRLGSKAMRPSSIWLRMFFPLFFFHENLSLRFFFPGEPKANGGSRKEVFSCWLSAIWFLSFLA